jgi:PAS domain S-box-containing protein
VEQLFGYHRDGLLDQPVEILLPSHLYERHVHHRAHYYTETRTRPMGSGLELRAFRKDGSEFPVEISLSSHQADGEILVTAVIRDITERRRTEQEGQGRRYAMGDHALLSQLRHGLIVQGSDQ